MAKTSMNIGADATLVGAARGAAMANVPGDYSKMFSSFADAFGKTMGELGEAFESYTTELKEVNEAGKEAYKNLVVAAKDKTINLDDKKIIDADIKEFKKRFRQTKGMRNKEERAELEAEVNQYFSNLKAEAEPIKNVNDFINSGQYNEEVVGAPNLAFLSQVALAAGGKETSPAFSVSRDEKGVKAYSFTYYTEKGERVIFDKVKAADLGNHFQGNKNEATLALQTIINDERTKSIEFKNHTYGKNEKLATIQRIEDEVFTSEEAFMHTVFTKTEGQKSLYKTLMDGPSIEGSQLFKDLYVMNPEHDQDGDEMITEHDLGTAENYMKYVDNILRPTINGKKNPNFNKKASYAFAANHYANANVKGAYEVGKNLAGHDQSISDETTTYGFQVEDALKKKNLQEKVNIFNTKLGTKAETVVDPSNENIRYTWSNKHNGYLRMIGGGYQADPDDDSKYKVYSIEGLKHKQLPKI